MKKDRPKRILLTGGGTAGHVTPNLALLPRLKRRGYEVCYIGTARGFEHGLIAREGIPYYTIPAGKLRRYFDIKNVTDIIKIKAGFLKSLLLIARIRPDVLFSKGGFVSCPVVWACRLLRVPVVIHESDISPGLANRLSIPFAKKICYSFPETKRHLPPAKAVETGIPVREALLHGDAEKGRALCGFADKKPVLLIIGGSQGAQAVNAAVRDALGELLQNYNVCHLCGKGNLIQDRPGYKQFEYADAELPDLFALADAAISRAGATSLFELLALAKPALLIPLPLSASRGDQILNAQSFERQGLFSVLAQENLTPKTLVEGVAALFAGREEYIARMKARTQVDSAEQVIGVIEQAMEK